MSMSDNLTPEQIQAAREWAMSEQGKTEAAKAMAETLAKLCAKPVLPPLGFDLKTIAPLYDECDDFADKIGGITYSLEEYIKNLPGCVRDSKADDLLTVLENALSSLRDAQSDLANAGEYARQMRGDTVGNWLEEQGKHDTSDDKLTALVHMHFPHLIQYGPLDLGNDIDDAWKEESDAKIDCESEDVA